LVGKSFGDPVLQQRFTNFVGNLLSRYPGVIKYLEIGNEINLYFSNNQSQIPNFKTFLSNVISYIKTVDTSIMVGTVFAYAGLVADDTLLVNFSSVIDFMGYTIYIYGENFDFSGNVSAIQPFFDSMINQSAVLGKPFGIVEIGENSNTSLGSSFQHQADFIDFIYQFLNNEHKNIIFMSYYIMYDFTWDECSTLAAEFYPGYNESSIVYINFIAFLCGIGLYSADGSPKLGWEAFSNSVDQYIQNVTSPKSVSSKVESSHTSIHHNTANKFCSPLPLLFLFISIFVRLAQ